MTIDDGNLEHEVPGAFNLRDLGGIEVAAGVIGTGRVYRCDLLHRVDVTVAARWLRGRRVVRVIDLRTVEERTKDGHMPASESLDSLHLPLLDDVWSWEDEHAAADEWFLRDRTIEMYDRHPDRIVAALTAIASASDRGNDDAVLFHCTAGKDRTGVIASALLGVLGAGRGAIIEDYARSTAAMAAIIEWYRAESEERARVTGVASDPVGDDPAVVQRLIERAANPATMAGVLDHIERRHGGFGGWASDAGLDREVVDVLAAHAVRPRSEPEEE